MKIYLVFKINVVSVVRDAIIFNVVLNISMVSVVSDSLYFEESSRLFSYESKFIKYYLRNKQDNKLVTSQQSVSKR